MIRASIYEDSFISKRPDTISTAATMRMVFTGSPKKMRPTRKAPTAPIPVQIVYAVPNERVFIDMDKRTKLAIIVTIVMMLGKILVKPRDCFMEKAQTTSNRPAKTKRTHAIQPSFQKSGRPACNHNG